MACAPKSLNSQIPPPSTENPSNKHPAAYFDFPFFTRFMRVLWPNLQAWGIQVTRVNTKIQEFNLAEAPKMGGRAYFVVPITPPLSRAV